VLREGECCVANHVRVREGECCVVLCCGAEVDDFYSQGGASR
jgi:hypothetical protein